MLWRLLDPLRTLAWVRHSDVVIVAGLGVLEATVPLRPWGFPYSFVLVGDRHPADRGPAGAGERRLGRGASPGNPLVPRPCRSPGALPLEVEVVSTLHELMRRMSTVDAVVGSRTTCSAPSSYPSRPYPGYAAKHEALMRDMGMGDFCEPAGSVDLDSLIAKFGNLERERDTLFTKLDEHNAEKVRLLGEQFTALSRVLAAHSAPTAAALTTTLRLEEPASP